MENSTFYINPIITINGAQENLQQLSSQAHLELHLENNNLPFSLVPKSSVIVYCWQILTCYVHREGYPGGLDFSSMQSEISEVGGKNADLETNNQAHTLAQKSRGLGKEILFFLTHLFSFTEYCCYYSLFSSVL